MDDIITVSWYFCKCEYLSKYCDEYHQAHAYIPRSIIEQYTL